MTADFAGLTLSNVDNNLSSQVAEPSEPLSVNSALGRYKVGTLQSVASIASGGLGIDGGTAKDALSSYIAQLKSPDAGSAVIATDAAWSDFDSRFSSEISSKSLSQVDAVKQLSIDPQSMQTTLFGYSLTQPAAIELATGPTIGPVQSDQLITGKTNIGSLFLPSQRQVANVTAGVQPPVESSHTNVSGWFCRPDGTSGFNSILGDSSEGEGPTEGGAEPSGGGTNGTASDNDPDSEIVVPQVEFPTLELTGHAGSLDGYSPDWQITGQSVNTLGVFDTNTTADSDMTLPGVNFVHIVNRTWVDEDHWSITETLIMSFNLSETISPTLASGSESDTSGSATGTSSGDSASEEIGLGNHPVTETSTASLTVNRSGFVKLVFHAEKGMLTPVAAGVLWSVNLAFRDQASVTLVASGGRTIAPDITNTASTGGSSGGGTGQGDTGDTWSVTGAGDAGTTTQNTLPASFSSTSTWSLNIGVQVSVGGTVAVSSTPSLVTSANDPTTNEVERDINYVADVQVGASLSLGGAWAASSTSGDLNTPDPAIALPSPTSQMIDSGLVDAFSSNGGNSGSGTNNPIDVPENGVLNFNHEATGTAWLADASSWEPMSRPVGRGHQLGSSGSASSNVSNTKSGGLSFNAKMRGNDQLTALSGSMRNGFANKFGDDSQNNKVLVFSDGGQDGNTVWNGTLMVGRNVQSQSSVGLGDNQEDGFAVGSQLEVVLNPLKNTEFFDAAKSGGGLSFERLSIDAVTMTLSPDGGFRFSSDSMIDAHGTQGNSGGTLDADTKLATPDAGELKMNWGSNGFQYKSFTSNSAGLDIIPQDVALGIASGFQRMRGSDRNTWTYTYSTEGDTEDSLTTSGAVDSTGNAETKTSESFSYHSNSSGDSTIHSLNGGRTETHRLRDANYSKTYGADDKYDSTATPATTSDDTNGGSNRVVVTGYNNIDIYLPTAPYHYWNYQDLESGLQTTKSDDGPGGAFSYTPMNWDPRNAYERWVDGSGTQPTYPEETIPIPTSYPSNPYTGNGLLGWFAGQAGDAGDQGIAFGAGFADNVTLGASWLWRDSLGTDTVDYSGTAYSAGGWTAFAVQLPGAVKAGLTGVRSAYAFATATDDVGRCANTVSKLVLGGCFVPGTLVTLSDIPRDKAFESAIWNADGLQHDLLAEEFDRFDRTARSVATASPRTSRALQVPIEEVPLGARVPTKNPKPWEYDDSLPDPVQDTWVKLSITVERTDGGVVDAELIRPRSWVESNGIRAGQLLPLNIAELQVAGFAHVTAIEPCPMIADGEGSVITGRFVTRQVDVIARVEILGADGSIEVLEGTTIHPIWSLDRNDWVPLGELERGEQLSGQAGFATVLNLTILNRPTGVYNVEVHGEHVYEVGVLGVLVHNVCPKALDLVRDATHGLPKHDGAMLLFALGKQTLGFATRTNQKLVDGVNVLSKLRPDVQWIQNGKIYIAEVSSLTGAALRNYHVVREAEFMKILGPLFGGYYRIAPLP